MEPILMRPKEAAVILGVSVSWLLMLAQEGKIPFKRVSSRSILFRTQEIRDAIESIPPEPSRELARKNGFVYFIRARSDGPIKIGFALSVEHRLYQLQCANYEALHLLASIPGTRKSESKIQRHFRKHRIRGEWFSPAQEILDYVAATKMNLRPSMA